MGYSLVNILGGLLIVTSTMVVVSKTIPSAIKWYAIQSVVLVGVLLTLGLTTGATELLMWAASAFVTKVILVPFILNRAYKKMGSPADSTLTSSIKIIAMMLLIIGGGGAFKQVLVDSGVDKYIAAMMHETNVSPLLMAWSIAAVLRIALGSATVAAITAGGIVAPLIATTGVSPELMVIAVGSGSVIFSHVNDPGFWLFKEYFNLTIGETIKSWSALETIISVCGLVGVLLLNMVV